MDERATLGGIDQIKSNDSRDRDRERERGGRGREMDIISRGSALHYIVIVDGTAWTIVTRQTVGSTASRCDAMHATAALRVVRMNDRLDLVGYSDPCTDILTSTKRSDVIGRACRGQPTSELLNDVGLGERLSVEAIRTKTMAK